MKGRTPRNVTEGATGLINRGRKVHFSPWKGAMKRRWFGLLCCDDVGGGGLTLRLMQPLVSSCSREAAGKMLRTRKGPVVVGVRRADRYTAGAPSHSTLFGREKQLPGIQGTPGLSTLEVRGCG